jgi:hypothetical protein
MRATPGDHRGDLHRGPGRPDPRRATAAGRQPRWLTTAARRSTKAGRMVATGLCPGGRYWDRTSYLLGVNETWAVPEGACKSPKVPFTWASDRPDSSRLLTTVRQMAPQNGSQAVSRSRVFRDLEHSSAQAKAYQDPGQEPAGPCAERPGRHRQHVDRGSIGHHYPPARRLRPWRAPS